MCMRVRCLAETVDPVFVLTLRDPHGRPIFAASTEWEEAQGRTFEPGELLDVALTFDNWLAPGRYLLGGEIRHPGSGQRSLAVEDEAASFVVTGSRSGGGAVDIPHAFYYFQRGELLETPGT